MSLPNQDMLLSNDLSSPDINVPMSVTDKTPIIIPKAVRRERVLFAKTEDKDNFYKNFPQLSNKKILAFPGRLSSWKGQESFIKLISELFNFFSSMDFSVIILLSIDFISLSK